MVVINLINDELSYQAFASYVLYVIIACIIVLIMITFYKLLVKKHSKKQINSMEKNIYLIYKELHILNEKIDKIYYNDSDEFKDK